MINRAEIYKSIVDSYTNVRVDYNPSEWAEKHRILTRDVATMTGPYDYSLTPYLREIIDTLSPYHPAKIVAIMKGSQLGFTDGLLVNGICWMMANNPGNAFFLSADEAASKETTESRLDQGIASCGIQHLIGPNTIRKRNQRTGDTNKSKEFPGGRLIIGGLQSINLVSKQRTVKFGFFDDWEGAPISDKKEGSTFRLIQQRFKTAAKTMKQYYIATPATRPSNIEKVYLMGDQRKWRVPCPKCGTFIELLWHGTVEGEKVGVIFDIDSAGKLIEKSVGYVCQECGQFFKETYKFDINVNGKWFATKEPERFGFYSYNISCLASAPHMYTWTDYAHQWCDIYKEGIERKSELKVFVNQVLGQPWEEREINIDAAKLSRNCRGYEIGIIPNALSNQDGNGNIVMLVLAADLNGTLDDARLDYDVVAFAESGSIYAIDAGSVGTYQPGLSQDGRQLWSYRPEAPNNVWDYLTNEILLRKYRTDDGKEWGILVAAIDAGYMTTIVNSYVDSKYPKVFGIMGDDPEKFSKIYADIPRFKPQKDRPRTNFILHSNAIKDDLSEMIMRSWTEGNLQPPGFINFPMPAYGKYGADYFKQFEAETKVLDENDDGDPIGWKWVKKHNTAANHHWDCFYYSLAIKDIFIKLLFESGSSTIKKPSWGDYVNLIKNA